MTYSLVNGGKLLPIGTTGIEDQITSIPQLFKLEQNYPNPFNPTTTIKFSVAQKGNVQLDVYKVNGRKTAELLNGEKEPGNYEIIFDASKLSSGVYFYVLRSAGFFQSKKMIIMK